MIYVCFNENRRILGLTREHPFTGTPRKFKGVPEGTKNVQSRWDWKSYEEVCRLALFLTTITGSTFVGTDSGPNVSPRYDIVEVPKVGDPVSYAFNGDYYPDGHVVKVTKGLMVRTSTGKEYRRRKNTGSWVQRGGTWKLVAGHHTEKNPEV